MFSTSRPGLALLIAALLFAQPVFAFLSPLSEQAVREAYFLGQRHDGTYERLLGKYMKFLPPPKTGPYISSVAFLTPFIQFVDYSSRQFNYSAQQAQLDHRRQGEEILRIFVEIQLTESYGRLIPISANPRSNSPSDFALRPHDFWKDFDVRIYDGDKELVPADSHGHANSSCGRRGPCILTGATLEFDFPADVFLSDTATIEIVPPEGDPAAVDFDLIRLR
jgi:hypothetical protein